MNTRIYGPGPRYFKWFWQEKGVFVFPQPLEDPQRGNVLQKSTCDDDYSVGHTCYLVCTNKPGLYQVQQ